MEDAEVKTSSRLTDDPKRLMPKTDREDPRRRNDRSEHELPMCTYSSTESAEPRRAMPKSEQQLPKRM